MDLKRKLARLSSAGERPPPSATAAQPPAPLASPAAVAVSGAAPLGELPAETQARLAALRSRISALMSDDKAARRKAPKVEPFAEPSQRILATPRVSAPSQRPAEPRDTPFGAVHLRTTRFEAAYTHGAAPTAACLSLSASHVAELALDPSLDGVELSRAVFLDLETTGLAGGTGTLAFLVGLAWFEDGALVLEQLFLPGPGQEAPMLRYAAARLDAASCVVTFNGKSFDWPLLRTRCLINRLPVPSLTRHLDVLHCARRVFKFRLAATRLTELEREVLGFTREGDIDGAEIPASYFAYLRDGNGEPLLPVFTHNAHDLAALVAVLGRLGASYAALCDDDDARDRLGLAHVAARAGDLARAQIFAAAAALDKSGRVSAAALTLSADLARRQGVWEEAALLYEQALAESRRASEEAALLRLRLAKLYEHRLRDYERALAHARETTSAEGREANGARLRRILKRLGRSE